MRVAAIQLNSSNDKDRNLEVAARLVADAAADGAELSPCPRSGTCSATASELDAGAEGLDGPDAERRRLVGRRTRDPAARRQHRRAPSGRRPALQHLVPDRPRGRAHRHVPQAPHVRRRRRRGRAIASPSASSPATSSCVADVGGVELGLSVCYDLRFPELYRILAVRGARTARRALGVHDRRPGATTGRCCCGPARSRTRRSCSPPNQFGKAPPHYDSYGRSAIVDPWGMVLAAGRRRRGLRRRRPRPRAARRRSAPRCRRSPTAARTPTAGREPAEAWRR